MTNETEDNSERQDEELEKLRDKNLRLEENLHLQKTSWLYSHHLLWSVLFGIGYGAIIGNSIYIALYTTNALGSITLLPEIVKIVVGILFLIFYLGFPIFAYIPYVIAIKAPDFSRRSWYAYSISFLFFASLIFYVDPLKLIFPQYEGIERLTQAVPPMVFLHVFLMAFFSSFVPRFTEKCGYKLVLDGSTFCLEVDADIPTVSKQLEKLEEDFRFVQVRPLAKPDLLYFEKLRVLPSKMKRMVLQIFLQPRENKTDVVFVMHTIKNDIPMRTRHDEVRKIGETLMKWLQLSKNFTVLETENERLVNDMIQKSKKSFYRQPVRLPSRKTASEFLRLHYKDILIVVSLMVAFLAWLFPQR